MDIIKETLESSPLYYEAIDHYTSVQKIIRNYLLKYNPNKYYYDLDIINDDIYQFRSFIFEINEFKILILGYFGIQNDGDYSIHFCDVFYNNQLYLSYEQKLNLKVLSKNLDKYLTNE
jgi:hypothetical protein